MTKLIGAIFILSSTLYAGMKLNSTLKCRRDTLRSLAYAFELMSADMGAGAYTTRQALSLASERAGGRAGEFLNSVADGMNDDSPLNNVWRERLKMLRELNAEDTDELIRLGEVLGTYNAEGEREHLKRASEYISGAALKAEKHLEEVKKLNLALPAALGLTVIILLV